MSTTFLYVAAHSDRIKIGTSRYPERRAARTLGASLIYKVRIPDDKAADAEAYAHDGLSAYVENPSEWFLCDVATAIAAVKEVARRVKAGLSLETINRPWLANSRRGLIKASQRRADLTQEKMKEVRKLLRDDPTRTVTQVARICGLSRHTVYLYLGERPDGRERQKGKKHA